MSTLIYPVGTTMTPTSTPKQLPRRSTLVRKRDSDDEHIASSPGKKAKVTFDSDVEVRLVDDWEDAPEIIYDEVQRAFTKRALGDSSGYEKIKAIYVAKTECDDIPSPKTIKNYTKALLGNISGLTKTNSDLIQTVLDSEWLGRQEDYVSLYMRLLANLASVQGNFLGEILRMLVDNLTAEPPSDGHLPDLPEVSRSAIYSRTHKALQYLLRVVPSASRILSSSLVRSFPHDTDSRRAHVIYVQNLLRLAAYAPELREEILRLTTERLVKIDVQVQMDLEDLAEDAGEGLVEKIPQIRPDLLEDEEDYESSDESDSGEDEEDEEDQDARRLRSITKNVEKMDAILDILFSHYDQSFKKASGEDEIASMNSLISQFITIILPTHRSRHTQFLLFHFAQKSPILIEVFVGACAQITFDKNQPAMMRQASAAYLASFVARGSHVPRPIVREVFDYLASELERLRRVQEPDCRGPDLRRYSSFYVLVQAMLYIFCFRWRDLQINPEDDVDDDEPQPYAKEHHWWCGVRETLSLTVFSRLNPLKVCSPAIVTEFARVANHIGVIYVYVLGLDFHINR